MSEAAPVRTRPAGNRRPMHTQSQVVTRADEDTAASAMESYLGETVQRGDQSNGRPNEPGSVLTTLKTGTTALQVLDPWFQMGKVSQLPGKNNILKQCIAAMVTNIEGFGHQLEYVGEKDREESQEAVAEKEAILELVDQPNGEYSMIEMRERIRNELEHVGNGYMEVVEDDGKPVLLYHLDALTMQATTLDGEAVEIEQSLVRGGKEYKRKVRRRFRRYVQTVDGKKVWFKEFGDPRRINSESGAELGKDEDDKLEATAVIHFSLPDVSGVYGAPRWLSQLPAILGSRESELTNLQFFKDNAIPAMVLLVSGGMLTSTSAADVLDKFSSSRGRNAQNRLLVVEAVGDGESASDAGTIPPPRIDIKPLSQERQQDALFQNYDESNRTKIRSSFRLPPLFIGLSEEHTYASANASLAFAESQVFGPERNRIDREIQIIIKARLGHAPKFWRYKSNAPSIGDPEKLVAAIGTLGEVGAMTPNAAISIANELFDLRMPRVAETWGDMPFQLTLADKQIEAQNARAAIGHNGGPPLDDDKKPTSRSIDGVTYRERSRKS